jgi:hypothetical protein
MPATLCRLRVASIYLAFVLAAVGCGQSPLQKAVGSIENAATLVKSITEPNSARAAAPELNPTLTEMADSMIAALGNEGLSTRNISAIADLTKAVQELEAETERLETLKGLPPEFWNAFRLEWYQANAKVYGAMGAEPGEDPGFTAGVQQTATMLQTHGPERIIEFTLKNIAGGDKDAAVEKIRALAGNGAEVASFADPESYDEWLVAVGPVDDFDKLVAAVDFGTVTDQEKAKCEIIVELKPIEETMVTTEVATEVAPPVGYSEGMGRDGMMTDVAGEAMAPGAESGQQALMMLAAGGAEFATKLSAFVPRGAPGEPMFYHPNYHAQLAEHLFDAQSPFHEKAVLTLLNVPPQKVADKQVRGRIAQGYREIAFSEDSTRVASAIRGLIVWGGKFSAPLLVQLLEKNSAGGGGGEVEAALYEGLGALATPECAAAVVARLANSTSSPEVIECLKRMGPVAEEPLLAELPFEAAEGNKAAIALLAEIGTRKSNAILRLATKSENEDVATAALDAIRKIRDRERQTAAK